MTIEDKYQERAEEIIGSVGWDDQDIKDLMTKAIKFSLICAFNEGKDAIPLIRPIEL